MSKPSPKKAKSIPLVPSSPKFRKIASLVDAEKFVVEVATLPVGVNFDPSAPSPQHSVFGVAGNFYLKTKAGPMLLVSGDWIVTAADGSKHICKSSEFESTHELYNRD